MTNSCRVYFAMIRLEREQDEDRVKALFAPEVKWRLVEEFGPECFNETKDGNLLFEREYTNEDNLISWILTFGDKAEILEPEDMREKFITTLKNIQTRYKGE